MSAIVKGEVVIEYGDNYTWLSNVEVHMSKGDNDTFTCKANEPVYWIDVWDTFPLLWTVIFAFDNSVSEIYLNAAKFYEGKFRIHPEYFESGTHIAKLDISNVSHSSVGRYYCIKSIANISKPEDLINFKYVDLNVEGKTPENLQYLL